MASVSVTKHSAAQRQIDAAIRILFSGEDALAVHTVVAAAHRIVLDLAEKRNLAPYAESARKTIATLYRQQFGEPIPNHKLHHWAAQFEKKNFRPYLNHPANFLKHADRDAGEVLDQDSLQTDLLLLVSCVTYAKLGLEYTPEMNAFFRWHLAVDPHEDGDELKTASGYVHDLSRPHQLAVGDFMLSLYRESPELAPKLIQHD